MKMKTYKKTYLLIGVLIITGLTLNNHSTIAQKSPKVKNIILLIGDGMGDTHLYAGMTASSTPLYITQFPYSGFSITYSADNYVTDSGAGGTAISSGVKTNNGMIGVRPDKTNVTLITEVVKKHGFSTGVVSTSAVTHATPASFVAHNAGRGNYEDIAVDFLNGTLDLFIGGGENHFRTRKDGKDLSTALKSQGFDVVYTPEQLKASSSLKIAGLLAKEHLPKASEGREGLLELMTGKAIETLSRDKDGFFLMVEGSMIDWGAHDNDIDYVISEMLDFDKAVGVALAFAKTNKNTLVVVTADHETGGLTLPKGSLADRTVSASFSTTDHSGGMVPIFSYGPGAERFSGIHDNTFFFDNFINLLRIKR